MINDVKLSKKVNVVAKTPSTSKYINHFRFYSHREDVAKKVRSSSNRVVEVKVVEEVNFF